MLKSLLAFVLTRRTIVLMCLLVLIGGGFLAYTKLNIEAYPNPAPVILEITAQYAGQTAEEMERYYTIPMEVGLASTPGVDNIRSTSYYGLSFVRVTFKYGVDYFFAYTQAAIALQQRVSLPNGVTPTIQESSLVGEIYRYQVVGPPNFGITNLRSIQDWVLQRRLLTVPGIVQVNAWGGTTKEFEVEADLNKLEAYNVTLPQLLTAIGNANINVGGRTINIGQQSVNIRGVGLIDDGGDTDLTRGWKVEDIENIVLSQLNSIPILVKDVAKVFVGHVPRLGLNGRDLDDDVVTAIVVMNRTQQTKDVLARVKAEIEKINSDGTLPPGVKAVPFYDRGWLVSTTTHTVLHNVIFGFLLVFLIQWIFLGNLRSALVVGVNIPFALFFAIIIMVLRGEDANLLSIGAVDFGIIVDSAVILVENIFRHAQAKDEERKLLLEDLAEGRFGTDPTSRRVAGGASWTNRLRIIYASALQVDRAIFFSTLITVAAFIPLFTLQGVEGQIFSPMARTYGYALAGALLATFTVTPVLASLLLPPRAKEAETIVVRAIRAAYTPILRIALKNCRTVVTAGLIFLAVVGFLVTRLGTEFLPPLEEGNYDIHLAMPPTISLEAAAPSVAKVRKIILRHPEVDTVISQQGRPDNGSDTGGFGDAELFVFMKPFTQWPSGMTKDKLTEELQEEFKREFISITFDFSQYIQTNVEEGMSGVKGANSVKIIGPDLTILEQTAVQVQREMALIKGVEDLGIFRVLGQPNLDIRVNRTKTARYGLNPGDVNTLVQTALAGTTATTVLEADRQFNLTVRLAPEYRSSIEAVRNIKVGYQTAGGTNAYIPLSELADISLDTGASYIYHERNQRYIPIKFSIRGRDLGSAVSEAQRRIAQNVKLPSGYRIEWAGEFGELQDAIRRLEVIIPITLTLILVILYSLFNSLRDSLLVLAGIPFAVAGGVLSLFVSGLDFSISAAVGFVSLFGVSVMNNILILTYYNQIRLTGHALDRHEAMLKAAEQRMRPMLMTALSACIGLLPAALSTGIGSQVQRPLAAVVVGGMLIGPIMLLLVIPALRMLLPGTPQKPPTER
jgi:cobalt-zinc-cadmium resistance protein CzcA